jgi:hypothetical protein
MRMGLMLALVLVLELQVALIVRHERSLPS